MGEPKPTEMIYDQGGRGPKTMDGVTITTPNKPKKSDSQNNRRRAGIEAIISHLKNDHRMGQHYLHGAASPDMNVMLAAAGWNMKKWMERVSRTGNAFCRLLEKWAITMFLTPSKLTS